MRVRFNIKQKAKLLLIPNSLTFFEFAQLIQALKIFNILYTYKATAFMHTRILLQNVCMRICDSRNITKPIDCKIYTSKTLTRLRIAAVWSGHTMYSKEVSDQSTNAQNR